MTCILQIVTYVIAEKGIEHKGGKGKFHDAIIVPAVAGKKAFLRKKQCLGVKKSGSPEICLAEGISQLVNHTVKKNSAK